MQNTDGNLNNGYWGIIIRTVLKDRMDFLSEAIYSVISQSYQYKKIYLVVHNIYGLENIDETINLLEEKFRSLVDIEILLADSGKLRGHPINVGLEKCDCEYVSFLDDDDVIYPHMGDLLIGKMNEEKLNFIFGNTIKVEAYKTSSGIYKTKKKFKMYGEDFDPVKLASTNYITIHSYIFRYSEFREIRMDENLYLLEDWDFLLNLMCTGRLRGSYLDVDICEYRFWLENQTTLSASFSTLSSEKQRNLAEYVAKKHSKDWYSIPYSHTFKYVEDYNSISKYFDVDKSQLYRNSDKTQITSKVVEKRFRYKLVDKLLSPLDNRGRIYTIFNNFARKIYAIYRS